MSNGDSGIVQAHLPQARTLKPRKATRRIVYHTTGRNLPRRVLQRTGLQVGTRAFDDAVVAWYVRSGLPYYGVYLVGTSGTVYELANPDLQSMHAASLTDGEVAGDPPAWWRARWPGVRHPTDLLNGSPHINPTSLGIDMVPDPNVANLADIHRPATLEATAALGRRLAAIYGLDLAPRRHLGHEDADPWSRSTPKGGWDPGWDRNHFLKLLEG